MPNQQLVDYIRTQLKLGVTKDDLRKAIADAGWAAADTQAAFDVVEGKAPAVPPPVRPPVAPAQPQPIRPVQPMQPMPIQSAQPLRPVVRPRRRHTYLPWLLLILVVLVAIAAAFYLSPTLRTVAGWYLEGMPAPTTNALVPVGGSTATSTDMEATTTATSTPSTGSGQATSTNIIISTSTPSTGSGQAASTTQ